MKKVLFALIFGILLSFLIYGVIISSLVDEYLNDYSDLGRSVEVFEFYYSVDADKKIYYLGSSSIKEDLDGTIMDSFNDYNNFNLGNPASTPVRRIIELDKMIKSGPEVVVIGVGPMSFSEKWLFPYDHYALVSPYVEVDSRFYNESYPLNLNEIELLTYKRKFIVSALFKKVDVVFNKPLDYRDYNKDFKSGSILEQVDFLIDPEFFVREEYLEYSVPFENNNEKEAFRIIVDELVSNGVKVIVVKIPFNPLVLEKINTENYDNFISSFNVTILDYSNVYDRRFFYDAHHLNRFGRIVFSEELAKEVENALQ